MHWQPEDDQLLAHGQTLDWEPSKGIHTAQLFLFDCDEMGTGRWGGGVGAEVLEPLEVPLDFRNVGRLRDDWFGFIEEGGVLLLDKVSRVEVDLPAIISPLDWHSSDELVRKLVFDRRRRSLKKGMVDTVTMPQRSHLSTEMNDPVRGKPR